jgi:hypothetical protein
MVIDPLILAPRLIEAQFQMVRRASTRPETVAFA